MEDLIESLTRGNPTEVKVLLASVALALAVYQLVLIAVGYGKVRPPFLSPGPASFAHRATGDAIVVILAFVAVSASRCTASTTTPRSTSWRRWDCSPFFR